MVGMYVTTAVMILFIPQDLNLITLLLLILIILFINFHMVTTSEALKFWVPTKMA